MAVLKIGDWRQTVQRLMWPHSVVDLLPFLQRAPQSDGVQLSVVELVEFLGMRPVGPLYMAVQLWAPGRQYKELDSALPAGQFEASFEFRAAIYLDSPYAEGHAFHQVIKETGGRGGGGSGEDPQDIPAGDHVPGGEVLQDYARERTDIHGVQLHQIAGMASLVFSGLSNGIGARPVRLSGRYP